MNFLFLRGEVPQDRNPNQIMFKSLEHNDDMWTQLAGQLIDKHFDYGESWYWNGSRKQRYNDKFVERWVPSYKKHKSIFKPDVIFARGGFKEYDIVLRRYPDAFKIYYGAGKRFYPPTKFRDFDLILNDTPEQFDYTKSHFLKSNVQLWAKPAAENIFKNGNSEKKYDVLVVGNSNKKDLKGLEFAFSRIPKELKTIHVGISNKSLQKTFSHIKSTGWIPRKEIPQYYHAAKIAVVTCKTIDSCPRVIPEALACGCPLLVLDRVNFWQDKYINNQTGKLCSTKQFSAEISNMLTTYDRYNPYEYYKNNLSMNKAVDQIRSLMNENR